MQYIFNSGTRVALVGVLVLLGLLMFVGQQDQDVERTEKSVSTEPINFQLAGVAFSVPRNRLGTPLDDISSTNEVMDGFEIEVLYPGFQGRSAENLEAFTGITKPDSNLVRILVLNACQEQDISKSCAKPAFNAALAAYSSPVVAMPDEDLAKLDAVPGMRLRAVQGPERLGKIAVYEPLGKDNDFVFLACGVTDNLQVSPCNLRFLWGDGFIASAQFSGAMLDTWVDILAKSRALLDDLRVDP